LTSMAANHLGALGAGSPNGVSLPDAMRIWMACASRRSNQALEGAPFPRRRARYWRGVVPHSRANTA
jgi:hypothetical protein